MKLPHPDDDLARLPSPSASASRRFPDDQLLRRWGFMIHDRPKGGEPVWVRRGGAEFGQGEALALCRLWEKQEGGR